MDPREIEIGKAYRNEQAGFDIRVAPSVEYLGRPGHPFALQTRLDAQVPWTRPFSPSTTAAKARQELVHYLNDVKHPSLR